MTLVRRENLDPEVESDLPANHPWQRHQSGIRRLRNTDQVAILAHLWRNAVSIDFRLDRVAVAPAQIHRRKTVYWFK